MKYILLIQIIILFTFNSFAEEQDASVPLTFDANQIGETIQSVKSDNQDWRFSVAPIFWLPSVDGNFSGSGMTLDFSASTKDRVTQSQSGGELFLEFANGKWIFVFQPEYSDVAFNGTLKTPYGNVPAQLRSESISIDFWSARRWSTDQAWVDVLIGGRTVEMKIKVKTTLGNTTKTVDWYDPLVGLRGQYQLTDQWSIEGLVTAAGFGISNSTSESSVESQLGLNFATKKNWKFAIGYRTSDTTNKENDSKDNSDKMRMKLRGPYFSLGYKFK